MKKHFTTILLIVIIFVGLSLLLYPSISNYWNSFHQSRAIASYVDAVEKIDRESYDKLLSDAEDYNRRLVDAYNLILSDAQREEYYKLLDVTGTGIMGYIEIQKINCYLPIYHGTADSVLQIAIGHLEGSSLPIGGPTTHAVLSGHRGLPSAKLFTDLDKMAVGDIFLLQILSETLTYEVDQINIVLPHELSALDLEAGEDYCTLVTCTPYGINTHRMLVRGRRIDTAEEGRAVRVTGDALQIKPMIVAPIVAAPILLILLIVMFVNTGTAKPVKKARPRKHGETKKKEGKKIDKGTKDS